MNRSDLPRLTSLLKRLCAVFGRFYSEALLEGYTVGLRDADIVQVEANGIAWLTIGKAMPSPYDLSRATHELSPERQALDQWCEVLGAIRRKDQLSDTVTVEIVAALGGLSKLGEFSAEQLHGFTRREFCKLYVEASRDEEMREVADGLRAGRLELPA